jgi:hypothetical protein
VIAWLVPGIPFAYALGRLSDPDLFWHLATGRFVLSHGAVPTTDPFSWTAAGKPWTAHEWLFGTLMYWLQQRLGWQAILLFQAAVLALTLHLLLRLCRERSGSFPAAALSALLCGYVVSGTVQRPQALSWLLAVLFLLVLERWRRGKPDRLWLLPLAMVPWANLHGGFVLGLGLMAAYLAEAVVRGWITGRRVPLAGAATPGGRPTVLAGWLLAAVAAALVNPQGPRLLAYPLWYLQHRDVLNGVTEWLSPNFHLSSAQPLELLLVGLIALGWQARRPGRWLDLCLLVVATHMTLYSVRNEGLLAILAAPVLATALAGWPRLRDQTQGEPKPSRLWVLNVALVLGLFPFIADRMPWTSDPERCLDLVGYPTKALAWVDSQNLSARMLNHYDWGGYLIWTEPHRPVFIDGRADLYGSELFEEHNRAVDAKPDWKAILDRWKIEWVLIRATDSLAQVLEESPAWRRGYRDRLAAVYLRKGAR